MVSSEKDDLNLLEVIASVKGYESEKEEAYVCILFDLMLYRYSDI